MAVSCSLAIGESWTGVYSGFVGRLGTLPMQDVHGKSQTRKHLCGRGADKHTFLAAAFNWLTGSDFSRSALLWASLIDLAAQSQPPCFIALGTFIAPFLFSRLKHLRRVYDSRGNLAKFKNSSHINSMPLPLKPHLSASPRLVKPEMTIGSKGSSVPEMVIPKGPPYRFSSTV